MQKCPVCRAGLDAHHIAQEICPKCGSLEGFAESDVAACAVPLGSVFRSAGQRWQDGFLCPHWRSRPEKISLALNAAAVCADDVVVDLGSGTGDVLLAAAERYGCKCVGWELDEDLVAASKRSATEIGVESQCEFIHGDFLRAELTGATVVFVCLHDHPLTLLDSVLERAWMSGARVVSSERRLPGVDWPARLANGTADEFWFLRGLWLYAREHVGWSGVDDHLCLYQPSRLDKIDSCLSHLHITSEDVLCDLGSGTGEALIYAARRYGCRCIGLELDEPLVAQAKEAAADAGVCGRIEWVCQDFRSADLSACTAVFLYLLPPALRELRPLLDPIWSRGGRIVANCYSVPGWESRLRDQDTDWDRLGLWVYSK
eukprot:TRINITY_DN25562_c0_g1_i1.p1 TRINITY_DN25562_c0_g1~~TRINITY_DN25562_c0_g1_i1.p1  ORF type:complete len:373 (+),score=43.53 TRINITY_DN25562_c0_g1_i1:60-1178(+)